MKIAYLTDYPQHIPTLAAWHQAQWGHLNPASTLEKRTGQLSLHTGQPGIPMTLIAVEADTVLGSASLIENDLTTHPQLTPFLASVYVAPAYRGQGIASALVSQMIDEARQLGAAQLYLITPDQQPLYARLGWSPLEQIHYRGEWVTLMTVACAAPNDGL